MNENLFKDLNIKTSRSIINYLWVIIMIFLYQCGYSLIQESSDSTQIETNKKHYLHLAKHRLWHDNAAVAGVPRPSYMNTIISPPSNFLIGYESNKLALTPYRDLWKRNDDAKWNEIIGVILNKSFRLNKRSPSEVSERIGEKMKNGASIFVNYNHTLIDLITHRLRLSIRFSLNEQFNIPSAPFLILFGRGLQNGSTIDFTDLYQKTIVATEIKTSYAHRLHYNGINNFLNKITRNFFDLSQMYVGGGLNIILGHSYAFLDTPEGSLTLSDNGSSFTLEGRSVLKTGGTGITGNFDFSNPFKNGFKLAGWGLSLDLGAMLVGEKTTVGIALNQLGFIRWHDVKKVEYAVKGSNIDFMSLLPDTNADSDSENESTNGYSKYLSHWVENFGGYLPDSSDTFTNDKPFYISPGTSFNFGVSYRFNFFKNRHHHFKLLSESFEVQILYKQGLSKFQNSTFIPQLQIGAENNFFKGYLPFRIGFIFGGNEGLASTMGVDLHLKRYLLTVNYKAPGTLLWYPRRGIQLNMGMSFNW